MVSTVSTGIPPDVPSSSPTHMVTEVAGPEVGFTASTRPERNALSVVMSSTYFARRLPSAWTIPMMETIAFGVSAPRLLLPLYCVFKSTSIVLGIPYGPCIWNQDDPSVTGRSALLQLEHLFLLRLAHLFHFLDLVIGQLLDLVERALLIVFGNLFVLHRLLDGVIAVTANISHRGAMR